MTDNEIISALEHCINNSGCDDENCPLADNTLKFKDCLEIFLDLINRQNAEIERLQKYNTDVAFKHYRDGVKEFAERLKKKALIESGFEVLQSGAIDNLVKEMTNTLGRE